MATKLLDVESNDIVKILEDLLSDTQIDSCIKRLEAVKSALADTISQDNDYLLKDEDWPSDTYCKRFRGIMAIHI